MEYWIKLIRFPFTIIAGGVFVAHVLTSFIGLPWLYYLFLGWGLFWILSGTYFDVKDAINTPSKKNGQDVVKAISKRFYFSIIIDASLIMLTINIFTGELWDLGLASKMALGIPVAIIGVGIFCYCLKTARKLSPKQDERQISNNE